MLLLLLLMLLFCSLLTSHSSDWSAWPSPVHTVKGRKSIQRVHDIKKTSWLADGRLTASNR